MPAACSLRMYSHNSSRNSTVDARGRLVQDHQSRSVHERAGQHHPAPHAPDRRLGNAVALSVRSNASSNSSARSHRVGAGHAEVPPMQRQQDRAP